MHKEIKFKRGRKLLGILFCILTLTLSVYLFLYPEVFLRNKFSKEITIQFIGVIGALIYSSLLYSLIYTLPRKQAIVITADYLIDNSRYESLGKLKWDEIVSIRKLGKYSIELTLKEGVVSSRKRNLLQSFLLMMNLWKYKKKFAISSALLECNREQLHRAIYSALRKYKDRKNNNERS